MGGVLNAPPGVVGPLTGNVTGNLTGNVTGHSSLDLLLAGGTVSGKIIGSGCAAGTYLIADNSAICNTPPGNGNALTFRGFAVASTTPTNGQTWTYNTGAAQWQPTTPTTGVASIDAQTGAFTFAGTGVSHIGNAYTFSSGAGGVLSINAATGAFTFNGAGVSCTANTCTFSGVGSGVTSVGLTVPSWLSVSGSPITSSGTLGVTVTGGQPQNQFLATPNGAPGAVILRNIVAADVPILNQATTGTSGGLTGNPNIAITNLNISGTCTGCPGSGSLPSASSNFQSIQVNTSGVASLITEANSQINVVQNRGIDNTGVADVSTSLAAIITGLPSSKPPQIYLPSGTYKINSGLNIPCTVSTCNGIRIVGAGRDNTFLQTNCSGNTFGVWFNNVTNSGDNWLGPSIENLTIQDTSGTGACQALLRLTQMAEFRINNVKLYNAQGKQYTTGTLNLTSGTKAVTGIGTTWTSDMDQGFLWIGGFPQEICTFNSPTSLTLCSNWQQGTATGATYAIDYFGYGLMIDGGNSYNQYGTMRDMFMYGNKVGLYAVAEPSSGGTSRFEVSGRAGWIDGLRIVDSVGIWLGRFADTFDISVPVNETARGLVIESGHANNYSGEFEENGTPTVVTTCNGGVASKSCIVGVEINGDTNGTSYGNTLMDVYIYNAGVAIQTDSSFVNQLQIFGLRADGGNTNNYNFNGATGCPGNGSGVSAVVSTYDCNHQLVAQTIN
jgi:hypothetical protein